MKIPYHVLMGKTREPSDDMRYPVNLAVKTVPVLDFGNLREKII